jgi:predicted metalloprotease with PDZ domain
LRSALFVLLLCGPLLAQLSPEQKAKNVESFEHVWTTIRDRHWDNSFASSSWKQVHDELLPKIQAAQSTEQARGVIADMIGRVHLTHFGLIPNDLYETLDQPGKNQRRVSSPFAPEGSPGLETRVIGGMVLVTHVEKGSPAETAHIRPGWQLREIDDEQLAPLVARLSAQFH